MFYLISILGSLAILFFSICFLIGKNSNEFEYPRKVTEVLVRFAGQFQSGWAFAALTVFCALLVHPFAGGALLFMAHESWKLSHPAKPEQTPTDTPPTE